MRLSRDQQRLLLMLGPSTVAHAMLGRLSGTTEGGRSTDEPNQWVQYNAKGVRLEDGSLRSEVLTSVGNEHRHQMLGTRNPPVLVAVTWTQVASYGTDLPKGLRDEMLKLRRAESAEACAWWEFIIDRGGFPQRRRFDSDDAHAAAAQEWETTWDAHLASSRTLHQALKQAVANALPLTADDAQVDLLELIAAQHDHEPAELASSAVSMTAIQRDALATGSAPGPIAPGSATPSSLAAPPR